MEYEKIIVELLSRIKTLEEKVEELSAEKDKEKRKVGTAEIKEYINSLKKEALAMGKKFIILKANDIHKHLKLHSRMPAVCNAMKQCMRENDTILHMTASGFSSTFEVKYSVE